MKRMILTYTIILVNIIAAYGQPTKTGCNCPKNTMAATKEGNKPDTTFSFSDNHKIILCGYKEVEDNETYFSEFILQVCGQDSIIDFWGAIQTCRLSFNHDTLAVIEIKNLPTGIGRAYKLTDWGIEKIYFSNARPARSFVVNRSIRKYSKSEIRKTLKEFETAKTGLDDNKIELANRLFISAISGNKTARKYFKEFETKFGELDGAFAEEYHDLQAMLSLWIEK